MYVIKSIGQGGGLVAKPGSKKSYVHTIQLAQKYATREAAESNRCVDNEVVVLADYYLDSFVSRED